MVWGTRGPDGSRSPATSRLYHRLMDRVVGRGALPPTGADVVLVDRVVLDAIRRAEESHAHLFMLVSWLGFDQTTVECNKAPRGHGASGWTPTKKWELAVDSVTAFTDRPLRWIGALGLTTAALGLLFAVIVIGAAVLGHPPKAWSAVIVVTLIVGGAQMLTLGVVGTYMWRGLDAARRRPAYVVEATYDG